MKIMLFMGIICVFSNAFSAEQERFFQANQRYAHQDYAGAAELYRSIEPKTGNVWYNLGNSLYMQGEKLEALSAWHQALKKTSGAVYASAQSNLHIVENELFRDPYDVKFFYIDTFLLRYLFIVQSLVLGLFLLISWRFRKSGSLYSVIALIFLIGYAKIFYNKFTDIRMITKHETSVHVGPDKEYPMMVQMPIHTKVRVVGEQKDWYHVKSSGIDGWVSAEDVVPL